MDISTLEKYMLGIDSNKEGDNMKFSISDVGKIAGISKDRLRYYEENGLIAPRRGTDNNYRYYKESELYKVMTIQLYRQMGLGVKEIHKILAVDTTAGICDALAHRQSDLDREILALQRQKELVARSIDDCKKVDQYLNKFVVRKVKGCILLDKLDYLFDPEESDKFRDDSGDEMLRIRSIVRRIEFLPTGIVDNSVFVAEESPNEDVECVYTIVKGSEEYDVMPRAYISGMKWICENNVNVGRYCYVRPLLFTHLDNIPESFLEIFIPIEK